MVGFIVTSLVPTAFTILAFILSLLTLLAGRNPTFMEDVYILRVNTSHIATSTSLSTVLSTVGLPSNLNTGVAQVDELLSDLNSSALVGTVINTAAHSLGLHDFYTAHLMTWCKGGLTDVGPETTRCSNPKIPFAVNPIDIIESEMLKGTTLADLGLDTSSVDSAIGALETAYKVMSVCYLVGVILCGLCIFGGMFGVFFPGRALPACGSLLAWLAFLTLGVASGIATAIAIKARDILNEKAQVINVSANASSKFLGMTWAAVVLVFITALWWSAGCCCGVGTGRKNNRDSITEEKEKKHRWGRSHSENYA